MAREGEKNGRHKLTARRLKRWRIIYIQNKPKKWHGWAGQRSKFSIAALAERAKVAYSTMASALRGETWGDL